jgi:hypothetical protein
MDALPREGTTTSQDGQRDLFAFGAAYLTGLTFYFVLHFLLAVNQLVLTLSIVAVMLGYAIFVVMLPRMRVRLDQAGDNAYYLGLLFTLTSMGVALYEFGAETGAGKSGVDKIISNFGIALATTVMGIFLRVILHQMRVDPADVERTTRIELAEASKRVKASLDSVSGEMNAFHDEVVQRTSDVVNFMLKQAAEAMTGVTTDLTRANQQMLATTATAQAEVLERTIKLTRLLGEVATESQSAVERLKSVKAPPLTLANRLDKTSVALETIAAHLSGVSGDFDKAGTTVAKASVVIADSASSLMQLSKGLAQSQTDMARQLETAVKGVQDALSSLGDGLQRDRQLLSDLEAQSRASAAEALRAQAAATQVLEHLTSLTRELAALARNAG